MTDKQDRRDNRAVHDGEVYERNINSDLTIRIKLGDDTPDRIQHEEMIADFDEDEDEESIDVNDLGMWGDYHAKVLPATPERINVRLFQDGRSVVLSAWEVPDPNDPDDTIVRVEANGNINKNEFKILAPIMRDFYYDEKSPYVTNPYVQPPDSSTSRSQPISNPEPTPTSEPTKGNKEDNKSVFDIFKMDKDNGDKDKDKRDGFFSFFKKDKQKGNP